nr:ribonuclease H-like domain, reverse transcriptase, RNA-dependent DNA polymerase [Tanacetum cinerariifolium]
MTRSSTKELFSPLENLEQKFRSRRRLFDTLSLIESNSPKFDQISYIEEQLEEEEVILFYNGLDVLTRQILDLKGAIPSKTASDAKKVYAAQVGCELCKGPHYTKDCPQKEEGKTLEEAYYTQFGVPYQPEGQYRAARPGLYKRNNGNSSYPDRRLSMEESMSRFIGVLSKRHEASIKTLEIQIRQMSKVMQERGFGSLPNSTKTNPKDQVKSISTTKVNFSKIRRMKYGPYAVSGPHKRYIFPETVPFPRQLYNYCCDDLKEAREALVDLGASVSVMPFSTHTNLGLGILSHTRLTIELADSTIKQPRGIAENVLVRIGKFVFPIDFIILDIPEDDDKVIQNGNSLKRTGRDCDGRVIILLPMNADEHIAVHKESKARTTLLQSILDDHVADFHYMDDAGDIWNEIKARFDGNAESKKMKKSMLKQEFLEFRTGEAEGLHKGYDRMQKILSQLNQLKAKPEDKDINLKFLELCLHHGLSTISASKKMSYRDSLSYSSFTTYTTPSNSKTGSHRSDFEQIEKLDLEEMDLKWQMAMLSVRVHKFEQKAGRKIDFDKKESSRFNKKKVRCYKCQQRGHFARECRAKGGNDKQRYSSFKIKEIRKKEEDSKALITVDTLVDSTDHDGESDGVIASKEFGMIAGYDTEDAIEEGAAKIYNLITGADTEEASTAGDAGEFALMGVTSEVHNYPFGCDNKYNELQKQYNELNEQNSEYFIQVQAYKNSLKTLEKQKRVLQRNQLTLEDKIRVLSIKLKNTSNLLKHYERINADVETAKKELQTKLDNHLVQIEKWRISSKNLFKLIDSFMSVRTKVGLGFNNYIRENKLGWDDSAFSVFTTNSKDVEGRPLFNRFAKADSIKAVPPPLSGDYTSLSDHIDLDESQMSYGTKSSTSNDSKYVSNDFVSYDNSDKSSEVNTNDFAFSDSSVKSSKPKPNDSTSCASTSSVSTSKNKAEIESNVRTPIQEPIIVQDLPSLSCNSFDKNENTSRISCNKNGYFSKKAVCSQAVLLKTGKVNIPPTRPQPVPTGKTKSTHVAAVVPKFVAGSRFPEDSSMLMTFGVRVQACRCCFL